MLRGIITIQRQDWNWLSHPSPTVKTRLLSYRIQSRIVTDLLTGHNTLRRYFYIMGPSGNPLCRRCGTEEEPSAHVFCECEALASLRHTYLGSFFLDPGNVRSLSLGAIWNFRKGTGLPWHGHQIMGHEWPVQKPTFVGTEKARTHLLFYSILLYSILFYSILLSSIHRISFFQDKDSSERGIVVTYAYICILII